MTEWEYLSSHSYRALLACGALVLFVLTYERAAKMVPWLSSPWVDQLAMPLSVLTYGVWYLKHGEHLALSGGWGWDGNMYAPWARNFYGAVIVGKVNQYHAQKWLPSAAVHYGLRALRKPLSDANIQAGYHVASIACATITAVLWNVIASTLRLSRASRWLGFVLFFLTWGTLKFFYYDQVLLDPWGLPVSTAIVACYLTRRPYLIPIPTLIGAFAIPAYPVMLGAVLMLLNREPLSCRSLPRAGYALAGGMALVVTVAALYCNYRGFPVTNNGDQVLAPLLPLSAAALFMYITWQLGPLLGRVPTLRSAWQGISLKSLPLLIVLLLVIRAILHAVQTQDVHLTNEEHLKLVLLLGITKPLASVVAMVAFWGPSVLLLFLLRRELAAHTPELGLGACVALVLFILLSVDNESRHQSALMGVGVTCVVYAFDRAYVEQRRNIALVTACLALWMSKVWVQLESPPLGPEPANYFNPSWQRLFMGIGPWMDLTSYGFLAAATLIGFGALWLTLKRPWRHADDGSSAGAEADTDDVGGRSFATSNDASA